MASKCSSWALLLLLAVCLVAGADAVTVAIENMCNFTVWPAAAPLQEDGGPYGFELSAGRTGTFNFPEPPYRTVIWGRTDCGYDDGGRVFTCRSGDCGELACSSIERLYHLNAATFPTFAFLDMYGGRRIGNSTIVEDDLYGYTIISPSSSFSRSEAEDAEGIRNSTSRRTTTTGIGNSTAAEDDDYRGPTGRLAPFRDMTPVLVKIDDDVVRPPLAVASHGVLPADVLFDVLLRLPADELCRLRLVCRSWRSLTSDPLFAKAHSSRHPHVVAIDRLNRRQVDVLDLSGNIVRRIRLHQLGDNPSIPFDLLCVSLFWGQAYARNIVTGMVVGDMAAERSVASVLGLGHVPSTGEYKVLRIQSEPWETCQVRTLSSSSNGRWRQRPWPLVIISESSKKMALVGGVAYFLVDQVEIGLDSIASFDLATEEWRATTIRD
ncbi:hypothetical protein ACP70R_045568 [Stipagrostis hirtigluma subsp. patula]